MRAEPRSELHRAPKQIVVMLNWFTRGHTDADFNRVVFFPPAMLRDLTLDAARALYGSGRGNERRHDTVAGVFNLSATCGCKSLADNRIVHAQQLQRSFVA